MIARGEVCHRIHGRVRVRVGERRGDPAYFERVSQALARCDGVTHYDVNSMTGSILIEHAAPLEQVLDFAQAEGLFRVQRVDAVPVPGRLRAERGLERIDAQVRQLTAGEADLRTVVLAGLIGMGVLQLVRGEVLAPAVTLFWYALAAMHFLQQQEGSSDPGSA
jgi:hypothetical protein